MMLHRHFETETEETAPTSVAVADPGTENESGVVAEGADIATEPVQPKPKRTRKKST